MITWDDPTRRFYQHGLDHGVLYIAGIDPIPWNGLISVNEGGEGSTEMLYRDGVIYLADAEPGDHVASITSMMYPDQFGECIGIPKVTDGLFIDNQKPKRFSLTYRTLIGSGSAGDMFGYQIHFLYNCMATIKQRTRNTIGKDTAPTNFDFDVVCTPVKMTGYRPTAHFIVDTRYLSDEAIKALEDVIYGDGTTPATLPHPSEIIDLVKYGSGLTFIDHGDGTWTGSGSAVNVVPHGNGTWNIYNATGTDHGDGTYSLQDTPKEG